MERPILVTFGFPDPNSPRYRNLVKTYEREGWDVHECLTSKKGFFAKCGDLKSQFRHLKNDCDAVLVNFPGYYLMPLAWCLTRRPRKTLIFDTFVSISDTLVSDRKKVRWLNPLAWAYYLADVISCHLADEVLIDTEAHKKFFVRRFFLKPKTVRVVYVGTREDLFTPGPKEHLLTKDVYNILFIGSYIPLQGITYIVEAARLLKDETDIVFTFIGNGQTRPQIENLIREYDLKNIRLIDFQPIEELPKYLRSCDLALGIFGTSQKAGRVIPHKVYDAVACGIPVVTAKNQAIGERFNQTHGVFLCEAGNGHSLAEVILHVKNHYAK